MGYYLLFTASRFDTATGMPAALLFATAALRSAWFLITCASTAAVPALLDCGEGDVSIFLSS